MEEIELMGIMLDNLLVDVSPHGIFHQSEGPEAKVKKVVNDCCKNDFNVRLLAIFNELWFADQDIKKILNEPFDDDEGQSLTPLATASLYGAINSVNLLLNLFHVDTEVLCKVRIDGYMMFNATALWCAANAGHIQIVKCLIKHGANVNHVTATESTALRAACFEGRLDIVELLISKGAIVNLPNSYHNTCLMIVSHKGFFDIVNVLLYHNADPNKQALCGATALHYAAEMDNVEICDLLYRFGAQLMRNEYNLTPVMVAADRTNERTLELFLSKNILSREQKINAFELIGASFANNKENYNIEKAYMYLTKAMQLRYEDPDDVIKKRPYKLIKAYEKWTECQTMEDLLAIKMNHNSIHMESLVIRERILGSDYPDLTGPIIYRGAIYADQSRFDRCQDLWMYAIKLKRKINYSIIRDIIRFTQLFVQIHRRNIIIPPDVFIYVLESCVYETAYQSTTENVSTKIESSLNMLGMICLYLVSMATKLLNSPMQKFDQNQLKLLYSHIYKLNLFKLSDNSTLLHLAVYFFNPPDEFLVSQLCCIPCADIVELLLHCGAKPTNVTLRSQTPLHILGQSCVETFSEDRFDAFKRIVNMLINKGCHIDAVNVNGYSAANLITIPKYREYLLQLDFKHITLKCLAAQCIARHHIKYEGEIPRVLEAFVKLHKGSNFSSS